MSELILSTIVVPVDDVLIGTQLKKARLESKLSQEEVGNRLGVTWEMISRYENGRSSALKHLRKLADIYGKPITYFIANKEDGTESFDLNRIVTKLKDEGIGYSKSLKNVIKMVDKLSGRGIEEDLLASESYHEVSSNITDRFANVFALKLEHVNLQNVNLNKEEIGIFAKGLEAKEKDIVIGYDGISYKIMSYDEDALETPLAVLIATERRYRS